MVNFPQVEWIALALAVAAFAVVALIQLATRDRLMRCPETNGIAFVDV